MIHKLLDEPYWLEADALLKMIAPVSCPNMGYDESDAVDMFNNLYYLIYFDGEDEKDTLTGLGNEHLFQQKELVVKKIEREGYSFLKEWWLSRLEEAATEFLTLAGGEKTDLDQFMRDVKGENNIQTICELIYDFEDLCDIIKKKGK